MLGDGHFLECNTASNTLHWGAVQQTNKQTKVTNKNKCHQQTNKSNFSATAAPLHWDLAQLYFPFISNTKIIELGHFLERNTAISPLYWGTV